MDKLQIFEEFAGQDIWVMVINKWDFIYLIKILQVFPDTEEAEYRELPIWWTSFIYGHGSPMYEDEYTTISDILNEWNYPQVHSIATIKLQDPLEIYTTAEMLNLLESQEILPEE